MSEQPAPQEITDPQQVRMLAHPLRQRIAQIMRQGRPVSSTSLARTLGQSTGSTSYHLRQLAKHGFIEEVPELTHGRERWWRPVNADRRFPQYSRQSPQMREAIDELIALEFAGEMEMLDRFQHARDRLGGWADALLFSFSTVSLTPEQVTPFFEEYLALLYKYKADDDDPPPDARTFHARFRAFPEVSDAEVSDPGDRDTGVGRTGVRDTGVGRTGVRDTGVRDTGVESTRFESTGVGDVRDGEVGDSEAGDSDAGHSDAGDGKEAGDSDDSGDNTGVGGGGPRDGT